MALIILYSLTTLLLFISIEPFRVTGALLSSCYIPGLVLFIIGKRNKLSFDDLVLAFPCSIGISSILTLVLLYAGINVVYIVSIIHIIAGALISLYVITGYKEKKYAVININRQQLIFSLYALLMILLLCIPFLFGSNRLAISAHAFHHSLLVSQILNGVFPPENPGLGGTSIGYYWGFHSLVAALTVKTNLQQLQIMFILNVLSLYFIFCISYILAKTFKLSELSCYIIPFSILGLMRADAGILFLIKLIFHRLGSIKSLIASPVEPYDVLFNWIQGLPFIDTRLFSLHKLYNVSGMQLAVSLCYSYIYFLLKRRSYGNRMFMIGTVLVIFACFYNYPPLAIFLLFFVPICSCYVFFSTDGNIKEKIGQASVIAIPLFISGLLVLPYMLSIMASRDISSGSQGGILSIAFYDQSVKNLVVFMLPFPIIVYGAWIAIKRFSSIREFYFLIIGSALCLILTSFTKWPFNNSYKFNYIFVLFLSLFFMVAVNDSLKSITTGWLRKLCTAFIIILLIITPIMVESSHVASSFSTDQIYSFKDRHITYTQNSQKNEAYAWIQKNTPYNALLMLTYTKTNWPCCGLNNNYEHAAIAERALYVIRDKDYTVSNPEYAKRIFFREKLFETPEDPSVIKFFSELNRPVYILTEDKMDETMFFIEDRFKHLPANLGEPFVLKFQNDNQWVYLVDIKK